jgi:hypothetical protein
MEVDNGRRLSTEPLNAMMIKTAPTTMYETVNCNAKPFPVSRVPARRPIPAAGKMPRPPIHLHLQDRCSAVGLTGCWRSWRLGYAIQRGGSGSKSMERATCCPLRFHPTAATLSEQPGAHISLIVSIRLRHSSRSRRSSRSSRRGTRRPNCRSLSSILPSQHMPRSSHPGTSRPRRLRACQGWMRSRQVHCCRDGAYR